MPRLNHTALICCLLGLAFRLPAADLQLDAQLGFDPQTPLVRANTWSPITVTLRNPGLDTEGGRS